MNRLAFALVALCCACNSGPVAKDSEKASPDTKPSDTRKAGSDWPIFLGPSSNSVSTEKGILKNWPKEGLKVLWEVEMGLGYAPVVISEGRLFHFDRFGKNCRLTCRTSETGKLLWKFDYPTDYQDYYGYDPGPRCGPMVDGDRVYIHGPEGMLHCVNVADGKLIWKVDTAAKFNVLQNFFGVGSCPIVEDDLLIVQVGGSADEAPPNDHLKAKGNGSGIVAFDKKTGEVKWKSSDQLASYSSPVIKTIQGERWGFMFARGGLVAFNPKNGKVHFEFPWRAKFRESVNASNPVVVGDEVLITECYQIGGALLKVGKDKPEVIWSDEKKGREQSLACHWNTPIHVNGYVYGSSGRHEAQAELRCVDWKTGEVQWSQKRLTRSSLLLVDDHFLCMTEDGELILLEVNPKAYKEVSRWRTDLVPPCWAAPILSHGLLYIRGKDRLLCCELIPNK
ncbi:PQQ-binding-like beta-propeller repeat protein [Telmatocola sphagniphila]|uniref:PQQ-binding-like beta-propeller repeat protein n=1 Tax=Telmatocola sphagniphila TaxID=1123043 RepID=A0A8E6B7Z2_9BACT|nr:PQQ-like beta-propeller repeat protein [Telmatocola sphagniphila]QVL32090.1 PQQ-binding-like beta-propeller repeat protein [Telmatocola sphagniphila]